MTPLARDDRAVSDVVSFVIVFALIITSIGAVTTFGLGTLSDVASSERTAATERAFVALSNNIDELERGTSPATAGDISAADASLGVTDDSILNVSVSGTGFNDSIRLGALQYRTASSTISYLGGGVFRTERGGTTVVSAPSIQCTAEHAVVSLVNVTVDGSPSVGGGTVRVVANYEETTVSFPTTRGTQTATTGVEVETTDPRWSQYFETHSGWQGTGPYTCPAEAVYLRTTTVSIEFN